MKTTLVAAGLIVMMAGSAQAQNRDSDGDVLSSVDYTYVYRDSDGEVISILPTKYYYRDSDGDVISVIWLEMIESDEDDGVIVMADDGPIPGAFVNTTTNAQGEVVLPAQVAVNGLIYKVADDQNGQVVQASARVNPTAFGLD